MEHSFCGICARNAESRRKNTMKKIGTTSSATYTESQYDRTRRRYWGVTHIWVPRFLHNLWARVMCNRGIHLLDEVHSVHEENEPFTDSKGNAHYLVCDACGFELFIDGAKAPDNWRATVQAATSTEVVEGRQGSFRYYPPETLPEPPMSPGEKPETVFRRLASGGHLDD